MSSSMKYQRVWYFIIIQYLAFTLLATVAELIPDVPLSVQVQLQRQRYLTMRVIDQPVAGKAPALSVTRYLSIDIFVSADSDSS